MRMGDDQKPTRHGRKAAIAAPQPVLEVGLPASALEAPQALEIGARPLEKKPGGRGATPPQTPARPQRVAWRARQPAGQSDA